MVMVSLQVPIKLTKATVIALEKAFGRYGSDCAPAPQCRPDTVPHVVTGS